MTKISVMRDSFEGTDWKRAFAEALLHLVPDMNPDRADELSDGEYALFRKLEPAAVARHWVERQSPALGDGGDGDGDGDQEFDRASNGT